MLELADIPEAVRVDAYLRARDGDPMHWITYTPADECFFKGDDPLITTRHTPQVLWDRITPREPWPCLGELDTYRCVLQLQMLTAAAREELVECYRHVADQVCLIEVKPWFVVIPQGDPSSGPVHEDFVARALHDLEAGDLAALRQRRPILAAMQSSRVLDFIGLALAALAVGQPGVGQSCCVASHLDAAGLGRCERIVGSRKTRCSIRRRRCRAH